MKSQTWYTLKEKGKAWSETPQHYLGELTWKDAVKWAKAQDTTEVRLSLSSGYGSQGYYINTDKN